MRIKTGIFIFLCIVIHGVSPAIGGEEGDHYQIVFSTFAQDEAGRYAHLRDSIQAMLANRLTGHAKVDVLTAGFDRLKSTSPKSKGTRYRAIMKKEGIDYLVTGALVSLVGGLNIQVALYPAQDGEEILRFSVVSKSSEALTADVEQLSQEIFQTVFVFLPENTEDTDLVAISPQAISKEILRSERVITTDSNLKTNQAIGARQNLVIPVGMKGMVIGDIDGDGFEEIIVLSKRKLSLFKLTGKTIAEVAHIPLPTTVKRHAINLADLDGDGRQEIYISGTSGLRVSSMIVVWDNKGGFKITSPHIPWYLRPVFVPGKGWQLAGQKRGMNRIDFVSPGVFLLSVDSQNNITRGMRLPLPTSVNLFDFVYTDLDGDDVYEMVTIDQREKIKVYDSANELLWVSEQRFAGSNVYFGPSHGKAVNRTDRQNLSVDEDAERELIFMPGRIIAMDLDRDGRDEIIVNANKGSSLSAFKRQRSYSGGAVIGLVWEGSALVKTWQTDVFSASVVDHGYSMDKMQYSEQMGKINDTLSTGRLYIGYLADGGSWIDSLSESTETYLTFYDLKFFPVTAKR